jgi:D-alanyl-D-alanine carboxypeptidase
MRSTPRAASLTAVVAVMLIGAGVSCTSDAEWAGTGVDVSDGTSTASGFDQEVAAELEQVVTETMEELAVPGAVVLVSNPDGEWFEAFGTRTVDGDDPVTIDDHFRVGSNTKTVTGTVVLQLADEGVLSLDDPVARNRPDVPNGENISIAQLLDMSSGIANYSTTDEFNATLDADPQKVWDPEELVAAGLAEEPAFAPGDGFLYSNTNTVLLGLIIEDLTGMSLAENFRDRIFEPLGMDDTVMPEVGSNELPVPHPNGYMFGTNVEQNAEASLAEPELSDALAGRLLPNDHTDDNPSWGWAAGSLISTARDLQVYVDALVAGELLEPETHAGRMSSVSLTSDEPGAARYGLALAQLGPLFGHDGSLPGFQSVMGHDVETETTVIVLTNLQAGPDGRLTANTISQRVLAVLGGG